MYLVLPAWDRKIPQGACSNKNICFLNPLPRRENLRKTRPMFLLSPRQRFWAGAELVRTTEEKLALLRPLLAQHPASPLPQIWSQYLKSVGSMGHQIVSLPQCPHIRVSPYPGPLLAPSRSPAPPSVIAIRVHRCQSFCCCFLSRPRQTLSRTTLEQVGHHRSGSSCSRDPSTALHANTNQAHTCWAQHWIQLPRALSHQQVLGTDVSRPKTKLPLEEQHKGRTATSKPLHVLFINIWMTTILANLRNTFIFLETHYNALMESKTSHKFRWRRICRCVL